MRSMGRVNRLVNCGDISVDLITELLFASYTRQIQAVYHVFVSPCSLASAFWRWLGRLSRRCVCPLPLARETIPCRHWLWGFESPWAVHVSRVKQDLTLACLSLCLSICLVSRLRWRSSRVGKSLQRQHSAVTVFVLTTAHWWSRCHGETIALHRTGMFDDLLVWCLFMLLLLHVWMCTVYIQDF